jgi:serine/threonine protein kinase
MPRQQVLDYKYAAADVDVWAAAATLYFMLTASFPRDFPTPADRWRVVWNTDPVPVSDRVASIPPTIAAVLDSTLDDRENLSFTTAEDLADALDRASEADGIALP